MTDIASQIPIGPADDRCLPGTPTSATLHPDSPEKRPSVDEAEYKHEYPSGLPTAFILASVTLAYFLFLLDLAVISTATPAITSEFSSLVDVGWYAGAYQLASAAFQPLGGKIYSHFSIKWSFLAFFFVFEVGSAICGAAQSSAMFIGGRAVAGLGSAGIANGALSIIAAVLPTRKQPLFMGLNMGAGQLGLATGPLIGGAFSSKVSWRWCFYINLPLGVFIAAALIFWTIPEPKLKKPARQVLGTATKSLDLPGFFLVSPAAVMFFLGLQYGGNEYDWDSSVVIGLFVGAACTFALFLAWEYYQGDEAMVPYAMVRQRIIWSAAMTTFFTLSSILVADFYIAIYFQAVRNDSALISGVHMLPITLGMVLFTMISGAATNIFGYYLPLVVAGGATSTIGYGLLSRLSPTTSVASWVGYQVLYGAGSGLAVAGPYIAVQNLVPAHQIPVAMAIVIFTQNIGAATSVVAANAIFSNTLRHELEKRAGSIGVSPDVIVGVGVRSIRDLVSGSQLAAVLEAYSTSIDHVMYLGVAVSAFIMVFAWGLGWKDIHKVKKLEAITDKPSATGRNESHAKKEEISSLFKKGSDSQARD